VSEIVDRARRAQLKRIVTRPPTDKTILRFALVNQFSASRALVERLATSAILDAVDVLVAVLDQDGHISGPPVRGTRERPSIPP